MCYMTVSDRCNAIVIIAVLFDANIDQTILGSTNRFRTSCMPLLPLNSDCGVCSWLQAKPYADFCRYRSHKFVFQFFSVKLSS